MIGIILAASVLIECEAFESLGGWTVETQSMRQLGSSYVMAHGCGVPVADAVTNVKIPEAGEYALWARTRNWNAEWTGGAAGRFEVVIGKASETLGLGSGTWTWRKAGSFSLKAGRQEVRLHDLTGFNGRCDALYLTTDGDRPPDDAVTLAAWRREKGGTAVRDDAKTYDLVVVGGGVAGCCAALTAARSGVKTLLLQDRPVLGGCNSSEVRVGLGGRIRTGPYPELGNVVHDIQPIVSNNSPLDGRYFEDDRKRTAFELWDIRRWDMPGERPDLRLNEYVYAVETNAGRRIVAVIARNTLDGSETRFRATLFCDATGDATLARLAGCETMYGCEERSRFNEISAPVMATRQVMGQSVQWTSEKRGQASPFPDISEWALPVDEKSGRYQRTGSWEQETGFFRDMADDTEAIRDYGLLAVFSNWHWIKNRSEQRAKYAKDALKWVSPVGGKRESYRVVGDHVLTQNDLENNVEYPDATAVATWGIDFHFPDPENARHFKEPFRAVAYHRGNGVDYPVPYRCLYARDCPNLFLAGRDISVSHCAFAAVRVMRTLGMLGEVVGLAADVCTRRKCTPREVYEKYLKQLKGRMKAGAPKLPDFHGYSVSLAESYDLNSRGWLKVYPGGKAGTLSDEMKAEIRGYGYIHRNEHPDLQDGRRRLVLADESRAKLHYYDSFDPKAGFSVGVEKPVWDLKKTGDMRYRIVCHGGFMVVDMKERKVVDTFRFKDFKEWMATAVVDLPGGGFLFSVNPRGSDSGKAIHFYEFDSGRKLVRTCRLSGFFNSRSMLRQADGELIVTHEHGFVRVRLPEKGTACEVIRDYPQPAGRNLFTAVPDRSGAGYWAGTGYGADLVHYAAGGDVISVWKADQGGKQNVFYGQPYELPNGHVYMCNWTGHGEQDSYKGWQVIEFDRDGKVFWRLDSPDRFGSISGIDVIETPK